MAYEKNKSLIAKRFGRCAPQYESVTPVQNQMAEHLASLVERHFALQPPRTILELGCGSGRLSRKLLERFPDAELTAIDLAPEMINAAKASIKGPNFQVADAEAFWRTCNQEFDLIISNATVQWFEVPGKTLKEYHKRLAENGLLAIATFANGTFQELQAAFSAAYKQLGQEPVEHTHRLPGKPFWAEVFPVAYYQEEHIRQEFLDVRPFLRSIQRAGATHSPQTNTTLTPSLYRAMADYYRKTFSLDNGNISATYHALYILASR